MKLGRISGGFLSVLRNLKSNISWDLGLWSLSSLKSWFPVTPVFIKCGMKNSEFKELLSVGFPLHQFL